jgi:transposase InsO family protein
LTIVKVKSDHGGESKSKNFEKLFEENDISHDFSCPRTPQQNGVVERKNRTLQEMIKTMIEILFFRGQMSYRMNILLINKYFILYV